MSIIVTQGTYRAFTGAENDFTAYIRDEDGKADLTGYTDLEAEIRRGSETPLLTVDATGNAQGVLSFTLTAENLAGALSTLGVFRLYVLADGAVIHTGTLEVLE